MFTVLNDSSNPYFNLAFEEYIFNKYHNGDIFLVWHDSPSVISGKYQNIWREVHVRKVFEHGIPMVRRMSGGGTVYHDEGNINYTFITDWHEGSSYDDFLNPVINALSGLGIAARKKGTSEIVIGDLKISGSAQCVSKGRILHHGTLLFDSDLSALDEITTGRKNESMDTKGTKSALCKVTNISEHLDHKMNIDDFGNALLDCILDGGEKKSLTAAETDEIYELMSTKYMSDEWTWGHTPAFTYTKTGNIAEHPLEVSYSAKKGIISNFDINCDLPEYKCASSKLSGLFMTPAVMIDTCRDIAGEKYKEFMDLII